MIFFICDKVVPTYVPSKEECHPFTIVISNSLDRSSDYLSVPLTLVELKNAMFSRKFAAPGFDGISLFILKHIPPRDLDILLKILNGIWNCGVIPL